MLDQNSPLSTSCDRRKAKALSHVRIGICGTSAVLAFLGGEQGADKVGRLLRGARPGRVQVLSCSISLLEVFYTALRAKGEDEAVRLLALMKAWPLEWVYPDEKVLLQAGRLKASHRLSVADALIAAVARLHHATLIHKDPKLEALKGQIELLSLPFKAMC
ncbi:MAG: PIN domain-containing protein [Acidobacteria bacterium]|nr:PIN domain-containing protein [Acidobacteriota bacterium]